jgi:hypothetical protein
VKAEVSVGKVVASQPASNKRIQRRPRSKFLIVALVPLAAPLMRGVRR